MGDSDNFLSGLNTEQREAVAAPHDRHLLILAGAGCGKTTVLTRRITYLTTCGIALPSIVALTFTRKAADEMAARAMRLAEESGCRQDAPTITTFHAFALQVLSASFDGTINFSRIGFSGIPRCLDEQERLRLLAGCSTPEERRELQCDIPALDALLERYHFAPESADTLATGSGELLRSVAERFRQCKQQQGVWDFSDLIEGVVTLFDRDTRVADCIRERYRAVLVDEFQDTNPLQVRLLHQLLADGKRLFAVGDDDQAIYGFRGAGPGPIAWPSGGDSPGGFGPR